MDPSKVQDVLDQRPPKTVH
jgi:hypothetical protein